MLLAAVDFDNLHQVLRVLYDEMMPGWVRCSM